MPREISGSQSVPTSWSELCSQVRKHFAGNEEFLDEAAAELADTRPKGIANILGASADALAEIAVGLGARAAHPLFEPFQPALPAALAALAGSPAEHMIKTMNVLRYVGVARCCGVAVPAEAEGIEREWLSALASRQGEMTERESCSMAFAALAVGAFEHVPDFLGGGALPAGVEPGQTFQLGVERFLRYMAAAAVQGRGADDVRPAYEELVQLFPFKLGAESLRWGDLLNAARAYDVHFADRPVETVARRLHELVARLAAADSGDALLSEPRPLLQFTPELRITYDIGQEHSPADPFGRTILVLEGTGCARLDVRGAQRPPRAWEARVDPAALKELLEALRRAGFPAGSQRVFVPDASIGEIRVECRAAQAAVRIDRYEAEKLSGYGEAYAILDSLAFQLSEGETAPPEEPAPVKGAITGVKKAALG